MAARSFGGKLIGGLAEIVSWIPFLLVLSGLGAASLAEDLFEYPDWLTGIVVLYQDLVYPFAGRLLEDTPTWVIDAGLVGIGLLSLAARTIFSFLISVIAFVAFAALFGVGVERFY